MRRVHVTKSTTWIMLRKAKKLIKTRLCRNDLTSKKQQAVGTALCPCGRNLHEKHGNKKQVLLVGWFGAENYGDELMLSVIYKKLALKELVEISILLEKNDEYNTKQWDAANLYNFPENDNDLEAISNFFDEVILVGGAHIDDRDIKKLNYVPFAIREISLRMIKKNKTVKWLAVSSARHLSDKSYIRDLQTIINGADVFSLRDKNSLATLKKAGVDTSRLTICNDIAYAADINKRILAVTLMKVEDRAVLTSICEDIAHNLQGRKDSWSICLLPFYNQNQTDLKLMQRLQSQVNWHGVDVFIAPVYQNIDSMILIMRACDAFVNMRYHASLLSLRMNKPTMTICNDLHSHYMNKISYLHKMHKNDNVVYLSKLKKNSIGKLLDDTLSNEVQQIELSKEFNTEALQELNAQLRESIL